MKSFKQFINEDYGLVDMASGGVLDSIIKYINRIKDFSEDELKTEFNIDNVIFIPNEIKKIAGNIVGSGLFSKVFKGSNGDDLVLKIPRNYKNIKNDGFVLYADMCKSLPANFSKILPKILYFEKFKNNKFYVCIMEHLTVDSMKNRRWWNTLNVKFGLGQETSENYGDFLFFRTICNNSHSNEYKRISFWASDVKEGDLHSEIYEKTNSNDNKFINFLRLEIDNKPEKYISLKEKEFFIELKKWVDEIAKKNKNRKIKYHSDVHSGNYGFRKDDDTIPVIFDPFAEKIQPQRPAIVKNHSLPLLKPAPIPPSQQI
jgi:hypothetical protein